ncbi:type I restriction endonuclease subunit R [Pseudanabaena sp. ABRG5-3]|uniref:type I restriction endonuclease subunit R n=1 Tax=Pseudanabaena sp. ABRG5-3 TaxID=685565 RepID=UPI000DC6EE68|nr:type I restriction endonuclease subunit R [Pseudanabaena sp. ABRG5-3]BBC24588.1 type I site-specific deoxyribonuclease, HsdR family [Pseudanabaena sp. ABRG5-3]
MTKYNEDTLVQQTTAEYLRDELGWDVVYAYNNETFGKNGTLGRDSDREVILTRYLSAKLTEFNPNLPETAYQDAIRQIVETSTAQTLLATNRDKYNLLKDGVQVTFTNAKGDREKRRLKIFDFENPTNNHFLAVRELWVKGELYHRRADLVGFVNGIPLLFMELKNINKDIRAAYEENFSDYKDTIPHLFHHNAFIVLGNGIDARIGSLSSRFEHFHEWKRLEEEDKGVVDMETLLKGICTKTNFLDLFENFILFDDSSGKTIKIVAQNHQYLGVNKAVQSVRDRQTRQGKLGVFWHTQGSGKSYSMVFFTRKIHRKLGANFTFVICSDRDDLDSQIYKTFAGCGVVNNDKDPCRASSGEHLQQLLGLQKSHVFTLIQKFNKPIGQQADQAYSLRDDIIVISDEAHRTQYGLLSLNMRNALPKANYIGFTGTPLFSDDDITRRVFGGYISTYDFQRAVDDKATVPLYYDTRGEKLKVETTDLNERIAQKVEELEIDNVDVEQKLQKALKRDYHIITAEKRLDQIARDFVQHYATAWESGKAMFICIDKITCIRMHQLIDKYWQQYILQLEKNLKSAPSDQDENYQRRQITWMKETQSAVIISEEQGEMEKFRKWGLDILPYRKLIKDGFELADGQSLDVESAFKNADHPFRIAIVCAMWLTGFDVPSLSTLYLDKPLKAHTLMQAIARANRIYEGKTNGLIVDYCGILKNLRAALKDYVKGQDKNEDIDPTKPESELLENLAESIDAVKVFLSDRYASLDDIIDKTGFAKNAAIATAKEAANENDQTRKRLEIMCRDVLNKFKACINSQGVNAYRKYYDAINILYKSLESDRDRVDITDILRQLQPIINDAISVQVNEEPDSNTIFDISGIDFERLRAEFVRSSTKNTTVQNLKQSIENRLNRLLNQNPLRTDLQKHYEEIVAEYNSEKDRVAIEVTFAALLDFTQTLDAEQTRAMREGLDEESLAIYDLLLKPDLSPNEIKRIKQISVELLATLKAQDLQVDRWCDKESTRDRVKNKIHDFLYSDDSGLPVDTYTDDDVNDKAIAVFRHVFRAYPKLPSPIYAYAA